MPARSTDPSAPPSRELLFLEGRALGELYAFFTMVPLLRLSPKGDGHPVLVLPGLIASDTSTRPLRAFLRDRGYYAHAWRLGPNFGPRGDFLDRLQARLDELYRRHNRKVSLVGWSLGGILARELAKRAPDQVRGVISLGSPFAGEPRASHAWKLYEAVSGHTVDNHGFNDLKGPPPVPSTAIFSRTDGIVAWQGCLEQQSASTENIEVGGSHCGLGHNPAALYAIADRLAQPEGQWRPFERTGLRALMYPDPYRSSH